MKFSKAFTGCADGDIYPRDFAVGDECPPELEAAAIVLESVDAKAKPTKAADTVASGTVADSITGSSGTDTVSGGAA